MEEYVKVTPCVGVWIEIGTEAGVCGTEDVTPCVGVWIEMEFSGGVEKCL